MSCGTEVFGALRRTLRACREDACLHRLEQNRASTRRPAGIRPSHHAQVSVGVGGGEGGRSFNRARDAAWRQAFLQYRASGRKPPGTGPPHHAHEPAFSPAPAAGDVSRPARAADPREASPVVTAPDATARQ